jgi:hypothetical protein
LYALLKSLIGKHTKQQNSFGSCPNKCLSISNYRVKVKLLLRFLRLKEEKEERKEHKKSPLRAYKIFPSLIKGYGTLPKFRIPMSN